MSVSRRRVHFAVYAIFVVILCWATRSLPDSLLFREPPTASQSNRDLQLSQWMKNVDLGLSRGRKTGFFVCVVMSMFPSSSPQLIHSFFEGLSEEERNWMFLVGATVHGDEQPMFSNLLSQFHKVVNGIDHAHVLALAFAECQQHSRLVLWLDDGLEYTSKSLLSELVVVEREAKAKTIPRSRTWAAVSLFAGYQPSWTMRTLFPWIFWPSLVIVVIVGVIWIMLREAFEAKNTLRPMVDVALLVLLMWLTICLVMGRQNLSPSFKKGANPYLPGQTHAVIINGQIPQTKVLIQKLTEAPQGMEPSKILDEVRAFSFSFRFPLLSFCLKKVDCGCCV